MQERLAMPDIFKSCALASHAAIIFLCYLSCSCTFPHKTKEILPDPEHLIPYTLIDSLPHDAEAFTQGLVYHQGNLYESTGTNSSWIAEIDPATGDQQKKIVLRRNYFGEGITLLNNKIYQLTWKNKTGFVYDAATFSQLGSFHYKFEGWGITTDGSHLLISDGSHLIRYLDTLHFKTLKTLKVSYKGEAVDKLNELEFIDSKLWANRWETNYLLRIDPQTGQVLGWLNLSGIAHQIRKKYPNANVLNGIAYDPVREQLYITGKYWPWIYIISLNK